MCVKEMFTETLPNAHSLVEITNGDNDKNNDVNDDNDDDDCKYKDDDYHG